MIDMHEFNISVFIPRDVYAYYIDVYIFAAIKVWQCAN